ncbi:MAG: nitrate ABC transporter permease [Acidimicrobiaceae bacterium]|nr:nitrate ABC transporter permease [Acidimicrobiaceae bacterium]MEC7843808.1 ABC transporter permease [Actinomycetota bacterium]
MSDTPTSETTKSKTSDGKSKARAAALNIIPPFLFGSLVIGGWYFISYVMLSENRRFLLRPPDKVVTEGFLDWGGTGGMSEMLQSLWSSTKVAGIGLFLAILIGLFLAVLMSQAITVEKALFPFLVTLQAIPILAIVPLISFWWGTGQTSRVVVCIIISLFPIIVNTLFGLQSAERGMHDLFTLHHASRLTRLRKLMFPAALPAMFAGLRISAGLSVIGAIVGDFFFGRGEVGLGQLIKRFASRLQGEELLTSVILSSILGVGVFLLFTWIQNKAIGKWSDRAGLV